MLQEISQQIENGNINSALQLNSVGTVASLANLPIGNASRSISIWINPLMVFRQLFLFNLVSPAANQSMVFFEIKSHKLLCMGK